MNTFIILAAQAQGNGGGMTMLIMMLAIFGIMWLFMIRPQQKKQKEIRTFQNSLREGDKVRLRDFGLMKLEIESDKVDDPKSFKPRKHIKGVRLHFLPESEKGSPKLYKRIKFEKEP